MQKSRVVISRPSVEEPDAGAAMQPNLLSIEGLHLNIIELMWSHSAIGACCPMPGCLLPVFRRGIGMA